MKLRHIAAGVIAFLVLTGGPAPLSAASEYPVPDDFREALNLYESGMYSRAMEIFDKIAGETASVGARGYSVLCAAVLEKEGYTLMIRNFEADCPESELIPQIKFVYAGNLFDKGDYEGCAAVLSGIKERDLKSSQRTDFLFRYAFSTLECGDAAAAEPVFRKIVSRPKSDRTAPSCYSLGYICYLRNDFGDAIDWFEKASSDGRFAEMSAYYILESRFMLKDYSYVRTAGPQLYAKVPEDRRPRLARMIAESFLVGGDAVNARKYYGMNPLGKDGMTRSDLFFAGSVLYATGDYAGAAECFSGITERTDSIGQTANYQLGYSYIKTKNKVAAMDAFRCASEQDWDRAVKKDALFNYAKLAFDLNSDVSVFKKYLETYPETDNLDIYGYVALTALYSRDWQGAIDAYDNIDDLTSEMQRNYMKANYLRAKQLLEAGSSRAALQYLRAVTFYTGSHDPLNQLAKYWMAEAYYRNGDYSQAVSILKGLYNISALEGGAEGSMLTYNLGCACFGLADYRQAHDWLTRYVGQQRCDFRKDALTRIADCSFLRNDYAKAAGEYARVADEYYDPDDIYPYWQSGVAYGLAGNPDKKIERLSEVKDAASSAPRYADALLELGRSYAESGDRLRADGCFDLVVSDVSDSSAVAQALLEKAMLARNAKDKDAALACYRRVVANMPGTEQADNALLAIESIYSSEGRAKEYVAYIDSIGRGAAKTAAERESLYFSSAEQLFTDRQYDRALTAFEDYLKAYPSGGERVKAVYYMAECYRFTSEYEKARDAYEDVIDKGDGLFRETSMLRYAELSYDLQHYDDAYLSYTALQKCMSDSTAADAVLAGRMRAAFKAKRFDDAESCASSLVAAEGVSGNLIREAEYVKAKSMLQLSRRDAALEIFGRLAENPSDAYGAEARYLLIQDKFDRADYKAVEDAVYSFSDSGTRQNYWLARSFIVLGDCFAEQGDLAQAKATFESIRDGYRPVSETDEVQDSVRMRLERLSQMVEGD